MRNSSPASSIKYEPGFPVSARIYVLILDMI